jgi:hypothetical protein
MTLRLFAFCGLPAADVIECVAPLAELLGSAGLRPVDEIEVRTLGPFVTPLRLRESTGEEPAAEMYGGHRPSSILTTTIDAASCPNPGDLDRAVEEVVPDSFALITESRLPLAGEAGPVCKLGLIRRRLDMSRIDYFEYWNTHHAPMVIEQGPLFTRYTNNRVLDDASPADGIVEQWFPSQEAMFEHDRLVAEEKTEIREDAAQFSSGFRAFTAT